jgi:hypothetical protein
MSRYKALYIYVLVFGCYSLNATFAINKIRQYDRYFWTGVQERGTWQFGAYAAPTYKVRGALDDQTKTCNILQIYQNDQNALAMVRGFPTDSLIGQYAARLNDVADDCVRGRVVPNAALRMFEAGIGGWYWLPRGFSLGLFLPFFRMKLSNISWHDKTAHVNEADMLTKDLLTNNLCKHVYQLGGLDIASPWKRSGIGDMSLIARWQRDFSQPKPILTNVYTSLYFGASLPTGKRADEDRLFALPFGYDGSSGVLFGGSLALTWKYHFVGGVDLDMTYLIGDTRCRRIKTTPNQSDLLLLAKTRVYVDWGFIQRYRLYLGAHEIIKGFSFDVNYQYQKQGDSAVSMCTNDYIVSTANTAESLKMWTLHQIGINAVYDFGFNMPDYRRCSPQIGLLWQHSFKGQRAILVSKWGFTLALTF